MALNKKTKIIHAFEEKIDEWINLHINGILSHDECEKYIKDCFSFAEKNNYLTKKDIAAFKSRKDGRSNTNFFVDIKSSSKKEIKFCKSIMKIFTNMGEIVDFKPVGIRDRGRPRIINKDSKADIMFFRNGIKSPMDIKELYEQYFKKVNLRIYVKGKAGIIVKSQGYLYIYSPFIVYKMYRTLIENKNFRRTPSYHDKICIKVADEPNALPLTKLVEKGIIEKIKFK